MNRRIELANDLSNLFETVQLQDTHTIKRQLQQATSTVELVQVLNALKRRKLVSAPSHLVLEKQPREVRIKHWEEDMIQDLVVTSQQHYKVFEISKKNGKRRQIAAPKGYLKTLQRDLALLLSLFRPEADNWNCSYGFEPRKSIQQNASQHIGQKAVLNLDLQDFFPSVKTEKIMQALLAAPLNLKLEVAMTIVQLVTYNGSLPQGAATSPVVSNFVVQGLDKALINWSLQKGLIYTRYADDLTFSGKGISREETAEVISIVERYQFKHHPRKLRLAAPNKQQSVTGLVVNEKLNVSRSYIKELRAILHHWKTKGGHSALKGYVTRYPENSWLLRSQKAPSMLSADEALKSFWEILKGKVEFVGFTTQWGGASYKSLLQSLYQVPFTTL